MRTALVLADRTAVLFLGIAAGAAIGYAFGSADTAPPPAPVAAASAGDDRTAAVAPPPPGEAGASVAPSAAVPAAADLAIPALTGPPAGNPAAGLEYEQPFQPHLLRAIAAGERVTIGVFGDSFGDGVFTALYRLLPAKDRYRVLKFSQQSTGFTRYARLNLRDHAEQQIAAEGPVDIAVISFGANDTQGVYADGHAAKLMSPEWQRIVGARVDGFVGLMRQRGVAVYWLGLPKMRAAAFDADITAMNDFYRRRMAALRVPFIDVHPLTVDPAGNYAAYLPDPVNGNEPRLLRANDGIHMSMNGYIVITRALAGRIRNYIAAATRVALPNGPSAAAPVEPPPAIPVPSVPRAIVPARPAADRPKPAAKPRAEPAAEPKSPVSRRVDTSPVKPAGPRDAAPARSADVAVAKPATEAKKVPADAKRPITESKAVAPDTKKPSAAPVVRVSPPALQLKLPPPEPETVAPTGDRS
jgi:hypothetical protein